MCFELIRVWLSWLVNLHVSVQLCMFMLCSSQCLHIWLINLNFLLLVTLWKHSLFISIPIPLLCHDLSPYGKLPWYSFENLNLEKSIFKFFMKLIFYFVFFFLPVSLFTDEIRILVFLCILCYSLINTFQAKDW